MNNMIEELNSSIPTIFGTYMKTYRLRHFAFRQSLKKSFVIYILHRFVKQKVFISERNKLLRLFLSL